MDCKDSVVHTKAMLEPRLINRISSIKEATECNPHNNSNTKHTNISNSLRITQQLIMYNHKIHRL